MRWAGAMVAGVLLIGAAPASAAFPGANGRISYDFSTEQGMQVRTSTVDGRRTRVLVTVPPLRSGCERKSGVAVWAPSGRRLVFQRLDRGVITMDARGRHRRLVAERPPVAGLLGVRARDLRRRQRPQPGAGRPRRARTARGRRAVRAPVDSVAWLRGSPTGRWIAYQDDTKAEIWRSRPDGSRARRLTSGQLPTWSPDGRRIAFRAGPDIRSIRPDGSGLRTLVRGPRDSSIAGLSYSPDGRQIAFVRQYPADAHDYSVMATAPAAGGRERERFRSDHYFGSVDWQPLPRRALAD